MSTNFADVGRFHVKFGLPNLNVEADTGPHHITPELADFRVNFMQEELDEIKEGYAQQDLAKIADGLVDLVYVAMGTAHLHHIPWQFIWDEVQRANMSKVRALKKEESTRGSTFDVVKPPDFKPPNVGAILQKFRDLLEGVPAADVPQPTGEGLCKAKPQCLALAVEGSPYCAPHTMSIRKIDRDELRRFDRTEVRLVNNAEKD